MARSEAGLKTALKLIQDLRASFWSNVFVPGTAEEFNPELEKALRVADFFELGELMIRDALHRNESCGGHFREEYATPEGETLRDDENFKYVAAWEFTGVNNEPVLHKEDLEFKDAPIKERNYK
jgi:succinate dehydrogenase / fumarate reductase, flavoprotein subunit